MCDGGADLFDLVRRDGARGMAPLTTQVSKNSCELIIAEDSSGGHLHPEATLTHPDGTSHTLDGDPPQTLHRAGEPLRVGQRRSDALQPQSGDR